MAIAYFIPDQAKLLAGQRPSRATASSNSRPSNNSQRASRLQPSNAGNETAATNAAVNRGYGTTINISVPTFNNTTQEPAGCWDFLTQVFCHALRFYHESSQYQPTVIQISVNFNATTTTTTDVAASNATYSPDTLPADATADAAPTDDQELRKCSKRKN